MAPTSNQYASIKYLGDIWPTKSIPNVIRIDAFSMFLPWGLDILFNKINPNTPTPSTVEISVGFRVTPNLKGKNKIFLKLMDSWF